MKNEADIIEEVYYKLNKEKLYGVAEVINFSCFWEEQNALCKVRYWLKYGLENNGDYTGNDEINSNLPDPDYEIPVEDIILAFNMLEEAMKENNIHISKKIA